jgi:hypothetical protein
MKELAESAAVLLISLLMIAAVFHIYLAIAQVYGYGWGYFYAVCHFVFAVVKLKEKRI